VAGTPCADAPRPARHRTFLILRADQRIGSTRGVCDVEIGQVLDGSVPNMTNQTQHEAENTARLLALVVASNGRVDPRELDVLDELDAFHRLSVARGRFVRMARDGVRELGSGLARRPWLTTGERWHLDRLLDDVSDPDRRLLLCRLAAAVVTADGCVTPDERLVYEHVLARWGISDRMVAQAILADRRRV